MCITFPRVVGAVFLVIAVIGNAAGAADLRLADAIRNHNVERVKILLAEGVPVNQAGPSGVTPLHWAVQGDHL